MARFRKPAIRRMTILLFVMAALSLTLFSCSTYCAQSQETYIDMSQVQLYQLEEPAEDAPAVVIHTTEGDITAVLYPEEAPNYVEQFMRLAEEGYYDNTYVFQVEKDVYFSAGSPGSDGVISDTAAAAPEENVEVETSVNLWPFRGALCVPLTGHDSSFWNNLFGEAADYCGTRFLVCDTIEFDETIVSEMEAMDEAAKEISDAFMERGGIPNYSQQMTIFGQAYGDESFETIDRITSVAVKAAAEETDYTAPAEDILIETIEVTTWGEIAQ